MLSAPFLLVLNKTLIYAHLLIQSGNAEKFAITILIL